MSDYRAVAMELLERIAKALEASNEMHRKVELTNPHGDIVQTAEQTERILRVQEQDSETRKRAADAWEEHNLWHRQQGSHPDNHPPGLN